MADNNDHNKVFDIMDRMLESILVNEPRIRALEFRVTILWWVGCTTATGLGVTLLAVIGWYLKSLLFGSV